MINILKILYKSKGKLIVIYGVDGVGKTTVINYITPRLQELSKKVIIRHLRPTILPALSSFKIRRYSSEIATFKDPHGAKPSGLFVSLFRIAYLILDYYVGYWFWIRPKLINHDNIIIFDRYIHDLIFDQLRFRISLPEWIVNFCINIIPEADLYICLHGDPHVISMRKNELDVTETHNQILKIKEFASDNFKALLVSTDASIDITGDLVFKAIIKTTRKK
jgi:thymidylate kinase